ncbi:BT4734/BF3469 family protein [Joostella sp.]|uniref:BT4734/BF3469 family protein n=1 Tax=Joostella sp. TaxID=2231138 RepID=UPI003A940B06
MKTTKINEVIETIKTGGGYITDVLKAREMYGVDKNEYDRIKQSCLPCYALNFEFHSGRKKELIKDSTGYIYLDVDGETDFDYKHHLVYASWVSLSGNGRGVLVKTEEVNPNNFSYVYTELSNALNIETDKYASKPTQPNVLSYDPEIYINVNSEIWNSNSSLEFPHYNYITNNKKEKKHDVNVTGVNFSNLRFNNLCDIAEQIDFNGELYKDFPDKIEYAEAYLPYGKILEGSRNNVLYSYAKQIRALSVYINTTSLYRLIYKANKDKCVPMLEEGELKQIINSVMSIPDNQLVPLYNKRRRFFYNSDYDLSVLQRKQISMKAINEGRKEKSIQKITEVINNWNFVEDGKITQKSIDKKSTLNIKTIETHYHVFKKDIKRLNKEYKRKM